ncbi:PREDICTED: cytochrome c oxidase subunit 6b-1-like [Tarenaya hassleriana]|uniref:cytochrome c oxidase subunit 6b-1-like n=1 Tax=Tarenaya hassleriana TaxID=28532 RepID=UPI00053CA0D7|nr:PREDICTED: cytochrome c oxidase subunit 6b-1-like [Tarenaya hassleriana]
MAEAAADQPPSLSDQYLLEKEEKQEIKSVEVKEEVPAVTAPTEEVAEEAIEASPAVESNPPASAVGDETEPPPPSTTEDSSEAPEETPAAEENNDENSGEENAEEAPEIKLETAPADFRFPTTNQTRHCFTRYIEYHRCVAAKGEDAQECDKFAKYYRSLCPSEWVERWNEQRENGTFPGPL